MIGVEGEVILRGSYLRSGALDELEIIEAAPRALISDELLEEIREGKVSPGITVDGDVLTIRGVNRTVIYRIMGKDPQRHAYILEWPD